MILRFLNQRFLQDYEQLVLLWSDYITEPIDRPVITVSKSLLAEFPPNVRALIQQRFPHPDNWDKVRIDERAVLTGEFRLCRFPDRITYHFW